MKKLIYLSSIALAAFVTACDDDYIDKFENITSEMTDVKSMVYTLTDADYTTIANNTTNKELALSMDPEEGTVSTALAQVGSKKYFNNLAIADDFIPAFLNNKYPNADLGSKWEITYKTERAASAYLEDFSNISSYTLSTDDYQTVWGDRVEANFLTPASKDQIPALLAAHMQTPLAGDMVMVNYAYSKTEPSIGGGEKEEAHLYKEVNEFDGEGTYILAAEMPDGSYIPWGYWSPTNTKEYAYMYGDALTVNDGIITAEEGDGWEVTAEAMSTGFTFKNSLGKYPYTSSTYTNYYMSDTQPASGGEWLVTANGDGTFNVTSVMNGYENILSIPYSSFGCYPHSTIGNYLNAPLTGTDETGFTIQNVNMPEAMSYIWKQDKVYGYKASAYVNKVYYETESWVVSPAIAINKKAAAPIFTCDVAARFFGDDINNALGFYISTDYEGDVTTAQWTKLEVENWSDGSSWNFVNTGNIDLSAYKGKTIYIGMKYTSTDEMGATIEVKNFSVTDPETMANYSKIHIFKQMLESEVEQVNASAPMLLATTRAAEITATNTDLYVYDGSAWGEYTAGDANVAVFGPEDYAALGASFISDPDRVLPVFIKNKYPYAEIGSAVAVVYTKNATGSVDVKEYTLQEDGNWIKTPAYTTETLIFSKDAEGISARLSVFFENSLLGDAAGLTEYVISLGTSTRTYAWGNTSAYGWRTYGVSGGGMESWLVVPAVNLAKATAPAMQMDHVYRYLATGDAADFNTNLGVFVSTDFNGDIQGATWTQLMLTDADMPTNADWNFVTTSVIDLTPFVGNKKVYIAFRYTTNEAAYATWEIKNLKIAETTEF